MVKKLFICHFFLNFQIIFFLDSFPNAGDIKLVDKSNHKEATSDKIIFYMLPYIEIKNYFLNSKKFVFFINIIINIIDTYLLNYLIVFIIFTFYLYFPFSKSLNSKRHNNKKKTYLFHCQ